MNILRGGIVVFWLGVMLAIFVELPAPFDRLLLIAGAVIAILHFLELVGFAVWIRRRRVLLAHALMVMLFGVLPQAVNGATQPDGSRFASASAPCVRCASPKHQHHVIGWQVVYRLQFAPGGQIFLDPLLSRIAAGGRYLNHSSSGIGFAGEAAVDLERAIDQELAVRSQMAAAFFDAAGHQLPGHDVKGVGGQVVELLRRPVPPHPAR